MDVLAFIKKTKEDLSMKKKVLLLLAIFSFAILAACTTDSTVTLTPRPTPTLQPTLTPTPQPTLTSTPQPTPTPTSQPTLTPTPQPTPTPTLESTATPTDDGSGSSSNNNFDTYNNLDQQQTTDTYVLNTSSMKIHHPSCSSVPKIKPQNYATSSESLAELKAQGYTTCGICFK